MFSQKQCPDYYREVTHLSVDISLLSTWKIVHLNPFMCNFLIMLAPQVKFYSCLCWTGGVASIYRSGA